MKLFKKKKSLTAPFIKWYSICLFAFVIGAFSACDSSNDDNVADVFRLPPTDLSLSAIVAGADADNPSGDGSGVVNFNITATYGMSYTVEINNETLELFDNTFKYTFTEQGLNDYEIILTAFNSAGSSSTTQTITVLVEEVVKELALVWSDEFDGNGPIDASKWTFDTGGGGWGNAESQVYTSNESNVVIEDGILKINALKETGSATTYYFDELNLLDSGDNIVSTIENFEGTAPTLNGFDGATSQVVSNPDISGENTTANVTEFVKNVGSNGNAGVFWDSSTAIDLSVNKKLSLKTWSPSTGVVVRLKLENSANGNEFHLVDATTSVSNSWETLTYDFSDAPAYTYDRLVVFYDHGTTIADYTSGRIKTQGLYNFTYGTVEVKAKLPASQGTWPAIWMLGSNIDTVSWPACGEVDIMEQKGWDKNTVLGTCHWSNNGSYAGYGLDTSITDSTNSFHVYKVEWTEDSIKISVDDTQYFVMSTNAVMPFNKDFFLVINVAMGGNLGGDIDPAFTEDTMEIDYVRVYQ